MKNPFKRFVAALLAFTMIISSSVFASEETEVNLDGLRVSDEFAAKHPNGMFEVLSPLIQTEEGKEFDFVVVRRGGTEGDVSVNLKVIEAIAKYDEDFVLMEKGALGIYHEIKKSEDNPTILESYIEENKGMVLTSDRAVSGSAIEMVAGDSLVSGNSLEIGDEEELTETSTEVTTEAETEAETETIEYTDGLGSYTSFLHKMKDEATGAKSAENAEVSNKLDDVFEIRDEKAIEETNEITRNLKGLSYTLNFADGEAYKTIRVKIKDDNIYESQEEFSLSLYDPTNGAELGDSLSSNIFIDDNDKVEYADINFEVSELSVYKDSESAVVKLIRSGNTNDFVNVSVSTLADSAKADEHYTPVIGEVMFLPGETEKTILIPILTKDMDIDDSLFFDLTAETEDNANIGTNKVRIEIKPYENRDNQALVAMSAESGGVSGNSSSSNEADVNIEPMGTTDRITTLFLDGSVYKYASIWQKGQDNGNSGTVDLTGIEYITWNWEATAKSRSKYDSRQISSVQFGNITKERYKTFTKTSGEISSSELAGNNLRKTNQTWRYNVHVYYDNALTLNVSDVKGHFTNFSFNTEAPDNLKAYTYKNAKDKLSNSEVSFNPGSTTVNDSILNRADKMKASGTLSSDGENYGCSLKKVILIGNGKSIDIAPNQYKAFDSDFITTYVYNGDQTKTSITAKAVYERTSKVNKINIGQYDSNMGSLKIDGTVYNNQSITSNQWYKGDKLIVDAIPNQGYNLQKIVVGNKEYKSGDAITLENNMTIKPIFQRDNNTVSVVWDQLGTGINEDHDTNMQHGVVVSSATSANTSSTSSTVTTVQLSTNKDYYNLLSETEKKQVYAAYLEKYGYGLDTYFTQNQLPEVYKVYVKNKYGITDEKEQYKYLSFDNTEKIMRFYAAGKELTDKQKSKAVSYIHKNISSKMYNDRKGAKSYFNYTGLYFTGTYHFDNDWFYNYITLSSYVSKNIEKLNAEQFGFLFSDLSGFDYINDIEGLYLYYLSKDDFSSITIEGAPTFDEYIEEQLPVSLKNKVEAELKEKRNKEIKEKYAKNQALFDNIKLNNLSVGDVVSLFAVVDDGYTCLWAYSDDSNKTIKESEQSSLALHVGDSFTFTVKDPSATVNFYFEKSSNLNNNALIKGRIVKSKDTLLKQSYFGVNINNPNTYTALPGIDVSTGSLDPTQSTVVNGSTYYASGQTDENGYFTIYAPNAINNLFTSIVFSNGEKQYVKNTVIKKNTANVVFEIPFMDSSYKFEYLKFNTSSSDTKKNNTITIADETRLIETKLNVEEGYNVSKVVLRSYNAKGNLVKAWQMVGNGNNVYSSTFNAKEYFKPDGRLTVEAYDIYGKGRGEVETGYSFYEPPSSGNMTMPNFENFGGANLEVIGNVSPNLSLGNYNVTPEPVSYSDGTLTIVDSDENKDNKFEIAVLSGEIMKDKIKEATRDGNKIFTTGTITDRVNEITKMIGKDTSIINATQKEWGKDATKDSSKGKFYSSGGKANLDVDLDIGFYMSMHTDKTKDGNNRYVFDQLYGLFGVQVDAKKDFAFQVGPVPVYVTIAGRVGAKGLIGMMPAKGYEDSIAIGGDDGWFGKAMYSGCYVDGVIGIFPYFSLGAGVGYRGVFSVGVSGQMNMDIAYQPWKDGAGTVEFSLNVDIDLAIIPLSFSVASIKLGMFYTKDYTPNSWVDFTDVSNYKDFNNYLAAMSVVDDKINSMTGEIHDVSRAKNGNEFDISLRAFSDDEDANIELLSEKSLRGTLKHPKPVVMSLGGNRQIMFYLGDDSARADYDCQAVYYTIYDGSNWSNPVQLDNNGTYDSDFTVSSIGNERVMIVWGDSNKTFGDSMPNVSEYLNSIDLKYCVFEADGTKDDVVQLTKEDNFSNTMPAITYDSETGRIMIAYAVTDYNDTRVEFSYKTMDDLNNFMNNAYSTIAYKMLDSSFNEVGYSSNEVSYMSYEDNYGEGSLDNQRFAAVTLMNDVSQLNINEMSISSYNKKAYLTYTIDTDGDSSTTEDMEIYATVISYEDNSSVGPIRVTNNDVYDSNPHTVKYDDKVWLYWNNDNNVVCADFDNAVENNVVKNTDGTYEVDSTYFNFDTVQEGSDAASTFTVSLEDDGYVYMLWNQLDSFDDESAVIDENDLYGKEATAAFVTKRSIYMRVYDPHYEKKTVNDDEMGSYDVYYGKWGSAVRIDEPAEGDTIYNEQSFSSKDTENAVAVFRRNKLVDNGKGGKTESDNSDLVIHNYKLVSTLDFDENSVYISPEHPAPGDDAILYVNVDNVGVLPSDTVTFEATMEDDKGNITPLGTYTYNTHIATDSTVEGAIPFNMPEDAEYIKFNVKAWEDNLSDSADEFTYTFKSGSELGMIDLELQRVDNDEGYIEGTLVNYGNKETGKMTFEVAAGTDIMANLLDEGDNQYNVIYSTTLDSLEPGDTLEINPIVDIRDIWGENTSAEIYITISNDDGTLYDEDFTISKFSDEDIVISDIVVNNGDTTPITVNEADSVYPKVKIAPNGADANYSLEYNVQDPDIATVDPSSGKITGVKAGKTKFIIKAIRQDYSYFVDSDGVMYNPDGTVVEFDESGNAINLFDADEGYVAMTKEVDVTVNSLDVKEIIEDETDITSEDEEEETEETTDESSIKLGHGSIRNLGKGTANTTTEAQTEETTEAVENADNTDNDKVDTNNSFIDIAEHWAKDVINFVSDLGVVKGYEDDTFRPNNSITRAEFLTILYNSGLADTTANADVDFDDVSGNEWYYDYIKWGVENNLIVGYDDNTFRGDNVISRQETAVVISKFIELANIELEESEPIEFADADSIAQWAKEYVDVISAYGIATGDNNNCYLPTKDLTRAETATIISRILK